MQVVRVQLGELCKFTSLWIHHQLPSWLLPKMSHCFKLIHSWNVTCFNFTHTESARICSDVWLLSLNIIVSLRFTYVFMCKSSLFVFTVPFNGYTIMYLPFHVDVHLHGFQFGVIIKSTSFLVHGFRWTQTLIYQIDRW